MAQALVRLDAVADIRLGRQRSPKNHLGPQMRPYLRAANIGWNGLKLADGVNTMNFTDEEMKIYSLRRGDLLLGEASGSAKEVGKPAIWDDEISNCGFQNTLLRVRTRGPDPRYLLHYFKYQAGSGKFASRSRGVGIHHLGREALAAWLIPLPTIEEQRRIAAILDHADALRAKRREALAHLDALTQSIFLDMFGDLSKNDRRWDESERLDDVAEISSGITMGRKVGAATTRAVPFMAVVNVQDRRLDLSVVKTIEATEAEIARYRLIRNDLLLTEGGDPDKLGRGTLWMDDLPESIHQNHIFRVRVRAADRVQPVFLNWLIGSPRGKRYFLRSAKQTTGIASINATQLRAFPMVLPPLSVQQAFAEELVRIEAVRSSALATQAALDALFASLQHRAFSGQL